MKLSLNRLHKYKTTLEKELPYSTVSLQRFYTVSLTDESNHSVRVATKFFEEQEKQLQRYTNLSNDLAILKTLLFRANVESGLNDVLNQLPSVKSVLKCVKQWKNQFSLFDNSNPTYGVNSVTATRLDELKRGSSDGRVNLELITESEIQKRVIELNKQIRELEDKQDKINAEYTVEVELTNDTKEVLGL
jgi:hypothetical protein